MPELTWLKVNEESKSAQILSSIVKKMTGLNELLSIYEKCSSELHSTFSARVLEKLAIRYEAIALDNEIIKEGKVVFVANHPFGAIDGVILIDYLVQKRPDLKVMANDVLASIPELKDRIISVSIFDNKSNIKAIREAMHHLENGGALLVFPAGEVSHFQVRQAKIIDSPWSEIISKLIQRTESPVYPIYVDGRNSLFFQCMGLIHPFLRTIFLPKEILKKKYETIRFVSGKIITAEMIKKYQDPKTLTSFLRIKTYLLKDSLRKISEIEVMENIIPAIDKELMAEEIAKVPDYQKLFSYKDFDVFYAKAYQIPNVLMEIGRCRELCFRMVDEGSGKSYDLDRYDAYYRHIFVWNRKEKNILGAYRIAEVMKIRRQYGSSHLYTASLFKMSEKYLDDSGDALELGRSFIMPEYQKQYYSLLLLWRGICAYVLKYPHISTLFGPVSISQSYHSISKSILVKSLENKNWIKRAKPRTKFKGKLDKDIVMHMAHFDRNNIDDLSRFIRSIENETKDIPILLKHYLKLGGEIECFNLDPDFNNTLDALIRVDLRKIPYNVLKLYMGHEAERYLEYHNDDHYLSEVS